jgi:hypothetical protein
MRSIFIISLFGALALSACKKDKPLTDSSAQITFSADSVFFDTTFASIGSTTRLFKIYNPYKQKIIISRAYVASGSSSPFRINIDGDSGPLVNDIEILPQDSAFVFVQVTINPSGVNAPLLVNDSIIFELNGNSQKVILTAIGQDVYLHKPNVFPKNGLPAYSLIDCSIPWTNDKPHLIFGHAVVDENNTLIVNAGTRMYMSKGAVLWIFEGGTIKMNGSKGNEVKIQGIRLEEEYKDIAGQWGKIWLMQGSKNNEINWAIIKNGSIGVQADSLGSGGSPLLVMNNTIIRNMASAAIYSKQGHIRSFNCVFANCGQYIAALYAGGNYTFKHCTFANYWNTSNRTTPLLYLSNYYTSGSYFYNKNLDSAYFGNCVLDGSLADEFSFDASTSAYAGSLNYKFENSILKTSFSTTNDGVHYFNVFANASPAFKNSTENDYQLQSNSSAIDKGIDFGIPYDLNNQTRPNTNTSIPDLGAYEFY